MCLSFVSVPGSVVHLAVAESKGTNTVMVSWDPPSNEACVEEYRVEFQYLSACNETSEPQVIERQSIDTVVNVTGIPSGTSYTVFVFAKNYVGESMTSRSGITGLQGMHRFFAFCKWGEIRG